MDSIILKKVAPRAGAWIETVLIWYQFFQYLTLLIIHYQWLSDQYTIRTHLRILNYSTIFIFQMRYTPMRYNFFAFKPETAFSVRQYL